MKKYNVQYPITGCSYGEPLQDYVILSEHYFLFMAFWTAYKLLFRQDKIKKVRICRFVDKICLFKIERFFYEFS